MKRTILYCCFQVLYFNFSYSQWPANSNMFNKNYASIIASQVTLTSGNILTLSHNTIYECIHLTDSMNNIHLIDIREISSPGYCILYEDQETAVLFKYRGSGSDNPTFYLSVSKTNCELTWITEVEP